MLDDAALALEEIEPEDKIRNEVLGARVNLYMAAKKWDMAAAVASHLVKVEPENEDWWISLAMIAFSLACYASVTGRMEEAKKHLRDAIALDKDIRLLAIDDEDLRPLWDWVAGLE